MTPMPTNGSPQDHNKPAETPWALFIGDSMFKRLNPASIICGGLIEDVKFQPHAEAIAWELNNMAKSIHSHNPYTQDGPGFDIIISRGTNDCARLQTSVVSSPKRSRLDSPTPEYPSGPASSQVCMRAQQHA